MSGGEVLKSRFREDDEIHKEKMQHRRRGLLASRGLNSDEPRVNSPL